MIGSILNSAYLDVVLHHTIAVDGVGNIRVLASDRCTKRTTCISVILLVH